MSERDLMARAHLRVERRLPVLGDVLVQPGALVQPDTVVARAEQVPGDPYVVDLVPAGQPLPGPDILERALQVRAGDTVAEDAVLAHLPGRDVRSPVTGRVELILMHRGRVLIREDPKSAQPVLVLDVARQLDIWPAMLPMYMQRHAGENVARGAVVAAAPGGRTGLLHVLAPAAGTIERLDLRTGYVYLVRPVRSSVVTAFLAGQVSRVLPDEGAVIEGEATVLQGVYGTGGEHYGELLASGDGDLEAGAVGAEARGKVLAVPGRITAGALARAHEVEVAGLVGGCCRGGDLARHLGREPGSVTGREQDPFALVLTEGFGDLRMPAAAWNLLRAQSGRVVSLSGATQVRAGAVRPRVILYTEAVPVRRGGVPAAGARVRVLRGRHLGRTGQVVALEAAPRPFPSGAAFPAAQVALDGAALPVWLPRANLEAVGGGNDGA